MNQPSNSRQCKTCGKPAMQGLSQCGLCLAESILRERDQEGAKNNSARKNTSTRITNLVSILFIVGFILAVIVGIFVLNSSERAFKSAQDQDTVFAYEQFLKKHNKSEYATKARARAAELDYAATIIYTHPSAFHDFIAKWPGSREEAIARAEIKRMSYERWQTLKNTSNASALREFIIDYPEAEEVSQASARIKELVILEAWERVRNSNDLHALGNHAKEYKGHETARLANQRIETLCNDYDWVKLQDQLPIYRTYLQHKPNSPNKAAIEKRIIDLEVAEILAGKHGKLPPSSPLQMTGGTETQMRIENQTSYTLILRYSGRQSYRFDLRAGEVRDVILAADTYQVAATVNSANVTPYAGKDTLQGGQASTKFYIETRRW